MIAGAKELNLKHLPILRVSCTNLNRNFVARFLIKSAEFHFQFATIYIQGKVIAKKGKFLCFLKFSDFHSCYLYHISACLVIHVACSRINVFVCRCTGEHSHSVSMYKMRLESLHGLNYTNCICHMLCVAGF